MQRDESHLQKSKKDDDFIDFGQYIRVIRRRKISILLITLIFLFMGFVYLNKATPIFQASAKIQADPIQPNASAQDNYVMNSLVFLFYETQYEIIQSRKVAEKVVEELDLVAKYRAEILMNGEQISVLGSIKEILQDSFSAENTSAQTAQLSDDQIKTFLAQGIQSGLKVTGGTQSQIINISYESDDPVLAANIVNEISEAYIQFGLEARLSQIKDTASWLSEQLEDLRLTLQASEDKLRDFRITENLMDTEQQQRIANTQLQTLNTELVKAQTQLSQAQELYSQIAQIDRDKGDYRSLTPVLQSNTIRDLVREEALLLRKVSELSERYGEKHPKMIAARSDLVSAQLNLSKETSKIVDSIKKEFTVAKAQKDNIERLIEETKKELQSYQGSSFELTRLEREVENNRRIYESFLGRLMEADVSGDYDASNIRIIDSATIPEYPIKPNPLLISVACLVLGVISGIGFAFFREFVGNVLRTPDQLESVFGLPTLGVTPLVARKRNGVTPEKQYVTDQRSTFAEAINTIRTGILFSNFDSPPQKILITSTVGSEGKTTLSINLAVALSQMDKTLLIEMDLRKPAIASDLGLNRSPGISEYLKNNTLEVTQAIEGAPDLAVLTCGVIPPNPMELISSTSFAKMLEEAAKTYKYIVIDSPPTLPVSDSCVLSKLVDATIVAVKAEHTKINMVKETISRLERVNATITGLVLTQASPQKMSYYGDHYYQDKYYGVK